MKKVDRIMIRALKGAPLSCYFLLKLCDRPLSEVYISENTGYSLKLVRSAMLLLRDYDLAVRDNDNNWQLAEKANLLNAKD